MFCNREGAGGALAPQDKVANKDGTESTVLEVLTSKHPVAVHPKEKDLEEYPLVPEMVRLDITADTVHGSSAMAFEIWSEQQLIEGGGGAFYEMARKLHPPMGSLSCHHGK